LVVSALMELKVYALPNRHNTKIRVPDFPPFFFQEPKVELVVTLVDPDQLKDQVDELYQNGTGKKQRDLVSFLYSKCASVPVIEELLKSVCDYHLEEASFRMFLVCHLSVYGLESGMLNEDTVGELKEQLYDDFKGALESAELLRQEGVFDSNPPSRPKRGRRQNEIVNQQNARNRDHHFAIKRGQLVSITFKI